MNKLFFVASALGISLAIGACTVSGGVGIAAGAGAAGTPGCISLSCGAALTQGLPNQGDVLCDSASDSAYSGVISCACGSGGGPCDAECASNVCVDLGETSQCGDCLNANCGPEHDTCANN